MIWYYVIRRSPWNYREEGQEEPKQVFATQNIREAVEYIWEQTGYIPGNPSIRQEWSNPYVYHISVFHETMKYY